MPTSPPPALPIGVEQRGDKWVLVDAHGGTLPEGEFDSEGQARTVASRINNAWSSLDAQARQALKVGESETEISEVSSRVYPGLERKPGKQNWVDYAGGLPGYIERIAKHIHYEGGRPIGVAIASAVNTVKRWCAGGAVSKTRGVTVGGNVKADTKAKACAALAQWEAKRARGRVTKAVREAWDEFGEETQVTLEEAAEIIEAVEGEEVERPEQDPLRLRLDEEIERHRRLVAEGADTREISVQRAVIASLRDQVEETQRVEKVRVHKDGRAAL